MKVFFVIIAKMCCLYDLMLKKFVCLVPSVDQCYYYCQFYFRGSTLFELNLKRDSGTGVFLWIFRKFLSTNFFFEQVQATALDFLRIRSRRSIRNFTKVLQRFTCMVKVIKRENKELFFSKMQLLTSGFHLITNLFGKLTL